MAATMVIALSICSSAIAAGNDVSEGQHYFLRYCASCHGKDGSGNGPVAKSFIKPPPNLRLLGEKYGTPLPTVTLADLIDGRDAIRAHGTSEMPVWGERFYATGEGTRGELSISKVLSKIVAFLDTIQDRRQAVH